MARVPITAETFCPEKIALNAKSVALTPEQFFQLCADNRELLFEWTAQKEILIMPPTGAEGDSRNVEIIAQVRNWTKQHKTGIAFGDNAGFTLPNGAIRSPDAAWIRSERWKALSKEERSKFAPICPDFVVELRSPSNTLRELKDKMAEYLANGAQLGWLIDPFERKVYVCRPGKPPQCLDNPQTVKGDPVLHSFELDLSDVWPEES